MDLKGQQLSERTFMGVMWTVTILSAVLTFILDDVTIMFFTFAGGLALSALICVPEWPMFNRNPLSFVKETEESATTDS